MGPAFRHKPAEVERGEVVERLGPAAAGTLTRGGGRAGGLRREGGATRRLFVAATAAALLLCVLMLAIQSQQSPAQAASNCKGIHRTVTYRDGLGQPFAYFQVRQTWCWDDRAVTYVSKPKVAGKVTKLGAARGWRYDGLLGKRDYYFAYKGLSRGGHTSFREGSFTVCANNTTQCYKKTPRVQITVYHDDGFSVANA